MKKIIDWLKNPLHSYDEGISILKEHWPKDVKFFESVKNPAMESYHFRKLEMDIKNIARKMAQQPHPVKSEDKPVTPNIAVIDLRKGLKKERSKSANKTAGKMQSSDSPRFVSNPLIDVKELPEDLQVKYFRTKEITTIIGRNHAQMTNSASSDADRKRLVNENTELETEKDNIWKELDAWWKNHEASKNDTEEDRVKKAAKAAVDNAKRVRSLKIQIARAEAELPKLEGKKLETRTKSIEKWKIELEKLEKELK